MADQACVVNYFPVRQVHKHELRLRLEAAIGRAPPISDAEMQVPEQAIACRLPCHDSSTAVFPAYSCWPLSHQGLPAVAPMQGMPDQAIHACTCAQVQLRLEAQRLAGEFRERNERALLNLLSDGARCAPIRVDAACIIGVCRFVHGLTALLYFKQASYQSSSAGADCCMTGR